jgi:hypothetical protein
MHRGDSFIWRSELLPYLVMPSGHVIELTIRCGNPMYNPRRADSMPCIPAPGQHIPDGYPKLTDDRSVTRNALPATSAEEAEVLEPGVRAHQSMPNRILMSVDIRSQMIQTMMTNYLVYIPIC